METLQRPQTHILTSVCHYIGARSAPFAGLMVRFPRQLQFKTAFLGFKIGKSPYEVSTKYAEFFSKLSSWENGSAGNGSTWF